MAGKTHVLACSQDKQLTTADCKQDQLWAKDETSLSNIKVDSSLVSTPKVNNNQIH